MAEIFGGYLVRDDQRIGILKGRFRIAENKRKGEHGKKRGVHEVHVVLVEHDRISILRQVFDCACCKKAVFINPRKLDDFGEFIREAGCQSIGHIGVHNIVGMDDGEKIEVIHVIMKLIEAQFVLDPESDQDEAGHAHGQSQNVNRGKNFVSDDVPECDLKIVADHSRSPVDAIFHKSGEGFENLPPEPAIGFWGTLAFCDIFIGFFEVPDGIIVIFGTGDDFKKLYGEVCGRILFNSHSI
jgi:hypothetical protein